MSKIFKKFYVKVLLLSTLLTLILNIGDNFINANSNGIIKTENSVTFKKLNNSSLGKTGVAITTNVGTRFKQRQEIPATIYKEVFSVNEIVNDQNGANQELIGSNMTIIEEYRNVLKTNIKQLLSTSYDKPRILDAFIEQLEYRYTLGIENTKNLTTQKNIFYENMDKSDSDIEILKVKIEKDFSENNSKGSLENIDTYLELKEKYYYSKTYISYINHFLYEYEYLNNYNKQLLDTLINNKDALVKDSFIVIPDSGTELLRNFNLIYTEEEYKK